MIFLTQVIRKEKHSSIYRPNIITPPQVKKRTTRRIIYIYDKHIRKNKRLISPIL